MSGLERRREREAEGWQFLSLSEGDHGTFDLPAGVNVSVEHEGGAVEAKAVDGLARIDLEGESLHNYGVYVASKDGEVVIACHRTAPFSRLPRLALSIPRGVNAVALQSSGGSLTASDFAVPVSLKTAGGSVRVRDQREAPVDVKTAGGSIKVDGSPMHIALHTSGGSIRFEGVTAGLDVTTSGGSVHIQGARLTEGEHTVKTSGGGIHIGLLPESSVEIDARTSAGGLSVDVPGVEGERSGSRHAPRFHGRYNGGAATLNASTSAGGITVELWDGPREREERERDAA